MFASSWRWKAVAALVVLIAIARIVVTYGHTSQAFDEPCHVAAALELLDHHSYTLDPVHPPLSRLAIGIPLYLSGVRYPTFTIPETAQPRYFVVGNHILYNGGHYLRTLMLARIAMLPFLVLGSALVFAWSRRVFGNLAAIFSVVTFTTTPIVLGLASIAYSDLVAAVAQCAAILAFAIWLDEPNRRWTFLLGAAIGLACLSKLTSFLFLPAAALCILLARSLLLRKQIRTRIEWAKLAGSCAVGVLVLWAGYGFSVGHVREGLGFTSEHMPTFRHLPSPARKIARAMVSNDYLVPAPAFLRGIAKGRELNDDSPNAYLLGRVRPGGWWYFFLVGIAVKAPLPLLILSIVGTVYGLTNTRVNWIAIVPATAVFGILFITSFVKYNAGVRHVLIVFPLLAVLAGQGAVWLWQKGSEPNLRRAILVLVIAWQAVETARAQPDFLAYFNELAGKDPSRVMVTGCDLDCGQDLFRLSAEAKKRNITHLKLAVWTTADLQRMQLPDFEVLQPYKPATGWIAISVRALRFGRRTSPNAPDAFDWLDHFQPVAQVGKTIELYHVSEQP